MSLIKKSQEESTQEFLQDADIVDIKTEIAIAEFEQGFPIKSSRTSKRKTRETEEKVPA